MSSKSKKYSRYHHVTMHRLELQKEYIDEQNRKFGKSIGVQPRYTDDQFRFECPVQKKKRLAREERRHGRV